MSTLPKPVAQPSTEPVKALAALLNSNQHAKALVDEAAQEISSVNTELKQGLADKESPAHMEKVVEKSESVEDKVVDAAGKLEVVNQALKLEVQERHDLEVQLAAIEVREETSRHAALHDTLTGLPNRALFLDRLEHGLAQAKRQGWNLAVLFIDLDGFKAINDQHGHGAGDDVLQQVAARLTKITRVDDTVSRYGGDEFLYVLMDIPHESDLRRIADNILAAVRAPCPIKVSGHTLDASISASIGIAVYPQDGSDAHALIKSADAAMYLAKNNQSGYLFAR